MSEQTTIDRDTIGAVDPTNQLGDVLDLGVHLRDALWRVDSADLKAIDAPALVVAGMGGSAIGGALTLAALGDRAAKPIMPARSYALPPWTTPETLVLCASYSGNTEETLAVYDAAGTLGAPRIAATTGGKLAERARADGVPIVPLPGGFQPRHSVGYSFVVALEIAALCGAGPSLRDEVEAAAALVESLAGEWGPEAGEDSEAKAIARALHGSAAVLGGAELTAALAYRWKCQLNENAKVPAFAHELPELDHNELVGWAGARDHGAFTAVFLQDAETHPRTQAGVELTAGLIESDADAVLRIDSRGETRTERVASLIHLGDLASLYLATLRGVDPGPVEVIESLKAELGKRD